MITVCNVQVLQYTLCSGYSVQCACVTLHSGQWLQCAGLHYTVASGYSVQCVEVTVYSLHWNELKCTALHSHFDRQQSWPSSCSSGYNNGNVGLATQKWFYSAKISPRCNFFLCTVSLLDVSEEKNLFKRNKLVKDFWWWTSPSSPASTDGGQDTKKSLTEPRPELQPQPRRWSNKPFTKKKIQHF
jgi:hypothetical protein